MFRYNHKHIIYLCAVRIYGTLEEVWSSLYPGDYVSNPPAADDNVYRCYMLCCSCVKVSFIHRTHVESACIIPTSIHSNYAQNVPSLLQIENTSVIGEFLFIQAVT